MNRNHFLLSCSCLLFSLLSCSNQGNAGKQPLSATAADATNLSVVVPAFNADSAYRYVDEQVAFGPRVPNTPAHKACGNYLADRLKAFGAVVTNQYIDLPAYDGTLLKARNIIGSFNPEQKKRIALFAHWDSRPWADADPDPKKQYTPVAGANDGASGVGILLEIARLLGAQPATLGVDLILLDAEDYGAHQDYQGAHKEEYWGMGAQYWARNPHRPGYNARFGILLDMVGGFDARFHYEGYSREYASSINRKVWRMAKQLNHADRFVDRNGGFVTDDHLFVNRYAGIPTIDIIPYSDGGEFFAHWHTVKDDMSAIDKQTLQAVGETVTAVVYNEK